MNTLDEFNAIHPKYKFSMEQQTQNRINYLDLSIMKSLKRINIWDLQKPHHHRPHITQHVMVTRMSTKHQPSITYVYYNRMNTYGLTKENKKEDKT
jgi:hypothetical protein